jgi:hypothetical protein
MAFAVRSSSFLEQRRARYSTTLLSFERPSYGAVLNCWRSQTEVWHREQSAGARACVHLENSIVAKASVLYDQEIKGTRWMPWRQEPMKDVGGCDKPGGDADQSLIPGCPNGETYAW